jgi:hypothetical protein
MPLICVTSGALGLDSPAEYVITSPVMPPPFATARCCHLSFFFFFYRSRRLTVLEITSNGFDGQPDFVVAIVL